MLYEQTKNLQFNTIFATYNKIKSKAKNKRLVDAALSVLQRGYWRMTNYGTLLTWSEESHCYWAATEVGCTCPAHCIHKQPYCKHMVARWIILKALQ